MQSTPSWFPIRPRCLWGGSGWAGQLPRRRDAGDGLSLSGPREERWGAEMKADTCRDGMLMHCSSFQEKSLLKEAKLSVECFTNQEQFIYLVKFALVNITG